MLIAFCPRAAIYPCRPPPICACSALAPPVTGLTAVCRLCQPAEIARGSSRDAPEEAGRSPWTNAVPSARASARCRGLSMVRCSAPASRSIARNLPPGRPRRAESQCITFLRVHRSVTTSEKCRPLRPIRGLETGPRRVGGEHALAAHRQLYERCDVAAREPDGEPPFTFTTPRRTFFKRSDYKAHSSNGGDWARHIWRSCSGSPPRISQPDQSTYDRQGRRAPTDRERRVSATRLHRGEQIPPKTLPNLDSAAAADRITVYVRVSGVRRDSCAAAGSGRRIDPNL